MPPIHPMMVHFPIALFTFAFIADLLGYLRKSASLRAAGFWSLVGAAIGIVLAAITGYYDMGRAALGETREYVDFHFWVGLSLGGLLLGLTIWRWRIFRDPERSMGGGYLAAALLVLVVMFFQGWYGGEMVYSQGAGVAAAGKGTEPSEAGHERLEAVTIGVGHEHENQAGGEAGK